MIKSQEENNTNKINELNKIAENKAEESYKMQINLLKENNSNLNAELKSYSEKYQTELVEKERLKQKLESSELNQINISKMINDESISSKNKQDDIQSKLESDYNLHLQEKENFMKESLEKSRIIDSMKTDHQKTIDVLKESKTKLLENLRSMEIKMYEKDE